MKVKVYYGILFDAKKKVVEVDNKFERLDEESELFDENNYDDLYFELYTTALKAVDYEDVIGIWSENDDVCYYE